jgi:hypothetical protein
MTCVVVVAPLKEGAQEAARLLIQGGPPFDPAETSLVRHHVYLTEREVVFVFEGPDAKTAVEALVGDPGVWKAATAWRDCLAGRPRIADEVFAWTVRGQTPRSDPG